MRIGIDARMLNQSGIGRYLRNLISQLQKIDRENDYYIFLLKEDFKTNNFPDNFHPILADFKWYGIGEQLLFPPLLGPLHLDLMHFPHFNTPILYRGKFVVTIHDLIHLEFKTAYASSHSPLVFEFKHRVYRQVLALALKRSQTVITVSDFVKTELVDKLGLKADKIVVTKEAVEESFVSLAGRVTPAEGQATLKKFSITRPYLFYVGNAHPHKNLEQLIGGFLELKKAYPKLSLVLSGRDNFFWGRLKKRYPDQGIVYTGFVSDDELVALFKNARVFVMPSLSEGFGIPVLEAFECGCPVVSSDRASLPEVGGEAALYFNPEDKSDLKNKVIRVLNNKQLASQMKQSGFGRLRLFDWNRLAEKTRQVYQETLPSPRPL